MPPRSMRRFPEMPSPAPAPWTGLVVKEAGEFADRAELVQGAARRRPAGGRLPGRLPFDRRAGDPAGAGCVFAPLVLATVAVVAISGAVTGKARAQRAADLLGPSAVRSMKDDLPRLLARRACRTDCRTRPTCRSRSTSRGARLAAIGAATSNGLRRSRFRSVFPTLLLRPVRARFSIATSVRPGTGGGAHRAPPNWAEARSAFRLDGVGAGDGQRRRLLRPLAERQGHGMRPDVAAALTRWSRPPRQPE